MRRKNAFGCKFSTALMKDAETAVEFIAENDEYSVRFYTCHCVVHDHYKQYVFLSRLLRHRMKISLYYGEVLFYQK